MPIMLNKMNNKPINQINIIIYKIELTVLLLFAMSFATATLIDAAFEQIEPASPVANIAISSIIAITGTVLIFFLFAKKQIMNEIFPDSSITKRENNILENISEGVIILSPSEKILIANAEFLSICSGHMNELKETSINNLAWLDSPTETPWQIAIQSGSPSGNIQMKINDQSNTTKSVLVKATPVKDESDQVDGIIVTIKNITSELAQQEKYKKTMADLRKTHKKIHAQNEALRQMAMQDHLTGCYNRHAFFEIFEGEWSRSKRYDYQMSCILLDIDQLKRINDKHGQSTGDEILRVIAGLIRDNIRKSDYVCRYSGEEFCILLPHTAIENAEQTAEKIRKKVEESHPCDILTTISLGISSTASNAKTPQDLTNQADIAMQYSVQKGQNRNSRWDMLPEDTKTIDNYNQTQTPEQLSEENKAYFDIPFQAVSALLAALEQRDAASALHCRRVADICVAASKGLMNQVDRYVLEVAALLHDIGKISVPDELLNKHDNLTDKEQKLIQYHLNMGIETISTSFNSSELIGILKYANAGFNNTVSSFETAANGNIPIRSRIIAAASTYDTLVNNLALTPDQALSELRQEAGDKFDPIIVERIAEVISARSQNREYQLPEQEDLKALRIGLELEKLICAAEEEDILLMSKIAESLACDAANLEIPDISDSAKVLESAIDKGKPLMDLLPLVNNIISYSSKES